MKSGKIFWVIMAFIAGAFISCELFNIGENNGEPYDWDQLIRQIFDLDGDGYCFFCSAGTDCDEEDANNWVSCATCADNDKDAWFVGCDSYQTIKGIDCDDADAVNWVSCATCADLDGDGYRGTDCDDPDDCDDSDIWSYPGAIEVCDGADNNCDDVIDEDEVVVFADAYLERLVRTRIAKPAGDILNNDLCGLTILSRLLGVSDLAGLEYCVSLELLDAFDNGILQDISELSRLLNLREIYFGLNQISDISALAGLKALNYINLIGNRVSDISPLAGLTNLSTLVLAGNNISDLQPLVDNEGLEVGDFINIAYNPLDCQSCCTDIPILTVRGATVFDDGYCAANHTCPCP